MPSPLLELFHNRTNLKHPALGDKDHGKANKALDVSDKDRKVPNFRRTHTCSGCIEPDGIVAGNIGDKTYLFTANEGDAREYWPGFIEEPRVGASYER